MAELVLKVGTGSGYEDGDICCAFNRRRIRCTHAENICLPKIYIDPQTSVLSSADVEGVIGEGSLEEEFCKNTHELKFERVSNDEVLMTRLSDGATILIQNGIPFINTFDADSIQYMHVELHAQKVRKAGHKPTFGSSGREIWYGGIIDLSHKAMDVVWGKIGDIVGLKEVDFQLWPLTDTEKKHYAAIPIDDFDDAQRMEYESSIVKIVDGEEIVSRKRANFVNYASIVDAATLADIQDPSTATDIRLEVAPFDKETIVDAKPLAPDETVAATANP